MILVFSFRFHGVGVPYKVSFLELLHLRKEYVGIQDRGIRLKLEKIIRYKVRACDIDWRDNVFVEIGASKWLHDVARSLDGGVAMLPSPELRDIVYDPVVTDPKVVIALMVRHFLTAPCFVPARTEQLAELNNIEYHYGVDQENDHNQHELVSPCHP